MNKIDFKKTLDSYKAKHNQIRIVSVPKMQFLMIDGHGDPNTSKEFSDAMETLFPVAYALKFMSKIELGKDYVVPPPEGLWWSNDMEDFITGNKSNWDWTMMVMVPDWITGEMYKTAVDKVIKKSNPTSIGKIRFEELEEGLSVQTLHIGSYQTEGEIINKMHNDFVPANGLRLIKKHHEIYLSDFRKVAPDKLKTIIRHPVSEL